MATKHWKIGGFKWEIMYSLLPLLHLTELTYISHITLLHIAYTMYVKCEILISIFPLLRTNYSNLYCLSWECSSIAAINSWKVIFRSKRFLNINLKPPRMYQFQMASINFIAHICTYIVHRTRQLRSSI